MDEKNPRDDMLYPHNVLEGFGNGMMADYRVRLALNFIATSPMVEAVAVARIGAAPPGLDTKVLARDMAEFALDLADELLKQGEARGMVKPLPDDEGLNTQVRKQATRTARYNVLQQLAGTRVGQEEQDRVLVPNITGVPFNRKQ